MKNLLLMYVGIWLYFSGSFLPRKQCSLGLGEIQVMILEMGYFSAPTYPTT